MEPSYRGDDDGVIRETNMDSFIEIELYHDKAYVAGNILYGTVHLYCKDDITDVKQVSLTLNGDE